MSSQEELKDYKLKVEFLQEKLQKSEDNRKQLEQQLDIILNKRDDRKRYLYKQSRRRYEQFLEEQKRNSERNKSLIQMLDGINQETTALAARTERLKKLKLQYEMYVASLLQSQSVGYMASSASEINGSIKGIPILMPTVIPELTNNNNKAVMEELSQVLTGNIATTGELTSCQWRLLMATPLPAGMLLMPTTSNITSSSQGGKTTSSVNTKNTTETVAQDTTQNDVKNREKNKDLVTTSDTNTDENTTSLLKQSYIPIEKPSNDKMQDNLCNTFKNSEQIEEVQDYAPVETIPSNKTEELVYEHYKLPLGVEPEKKILNYSPVEEEMSRPPAEFQYVEDIENLHAKVNEMQILPDSLHKEEKTNIENIENAIYGELVEPIENNLYLNSESTVLNNNSGINPLEVNYAAQENVSEENNYDNENQVNYVPEMDPNAVKLNYEPILVTTEAELYSQSTLDASQKSDIENNSQYINDNNNQCPMNNEQEYKNVDYAYYEDPQYENQYANVENVYDNGYPGYTFDAATGQYLSDDTQLPEVSVDFSDVNYDAQNVVYDETSKPLEAYGENNYVENIENSSTDIAVDEAGASYEPAAPVEVKEPQLQGKSVKPILATPSSSSATNEAQKKKKRVNFVDNKSLKDSSSINENATELSPNSSDGKVDKQKA